MTRQVVVLAAAALAACSPFQGDSRPAAPLRDFTVTRPRAGEPLLTILVDYAAGRLRVRPAPAGVLYRMDLGYDAGRFEPLAQFDGEAGVVKLGVVAIGRDRATPPVGEPPGQTATLELSPEADLLLEGRLGAADAVLDLTGLRLTELDLTTGASRTTILFQEPNPVACRRARIAAGAAELTVEGLGNAGCRDIVVEGGVGRATLDFTGAWPVNAQATLKMTIGGVRLLLPRGVGVRLTMDRWLASFRPSGLERQGSSHVYQTPGFEQSARRLEIAISTTLGGVDVEWR